MPNVLLNHEKGIWKKSVASTNNYLKENKIEQGSWISADEQTEGRGRKGRSWNSFGEDKIIFSGKIRFEKVKFPVSLFSLLTGCAVLKTLIQSAPEIENDLQLKWPNDIYRNGNKIAGILIECEQEGEILDAIVGIGVNLFGKSIPDDLKNGGFLLDKKPTDEFKKKLIENLINALNEAVVLVGDEKSIGKEIAFAFEKSYLRGKEIKAIQNQKIILGKQTGVTSDGFLIIETTSGERFELMDTDPSFEVL